MGFKFLFEISDLWRHLANFFIISKIKPNIPFIGFSAKKQIILTIFSQNCNFFEVLHELIESIWKEFWTKIPVWIIPVYILSTLIWDSILCAEFLHLLDCNVGLPVYTIWLEIHAIIICIFFSTFHWAFYLGENYQPRLNLYWLPGLNNFNIVFDS